MTPAEELSTPRLRRVALSRIDVDDPRADHELVRRLFDLEVRWRTRPFAERSADAPDTPDDAFEQVYVCAYLLFLIGDPADVPALFAAKFDSGDFDLACGMDAESMFGAGVPETFAWLDAHGHDDESTFLTTYLDRHTGHRIDDWDRDVRAWASSQRDYHYDGDRLR